MCLLYIGTTIVGSLYAPLYTLVFTSLPFQGVSCIESCEFQFNGLFHCSQSLVLFWVFSQCAYGLEIDREYIELIWVSSY